jgi:hypothetical protein
MVTYPVIRIEESGKVVEKLGEGRPWPAGSAILPGTPYVSYAGIDEEREPGYDHGARCGQ